MVTPAPKYPTAPIKYYLCTNCQTASETCECPSLSSSFKYDYWPSGPMPGVKASILHRGPIRVYFKSWDEAWSVGYNTYSINNVNKKGIIHPFTGLWGDAKSLWRDITLGYEKWVWLLKKEKPKDMRWRLQNSKCIVWACGYETNHFPIYDKQGNEVALNS